MPGASVMEWTVCYGMDSATAKGGLVATDMVYLKLGPEVEDPRSVLKSLLFGLLWLAKRSRINGIAIVLGQALRDRARSFFSTASSHTRMSLTCGESKFFGSDIGAERLKVDFLGIQR